MAVFGEPKVGCRIESQNADVEVFAKSQDGVFVSLKR